jgi:hypothetical protein
MRKYLATSKHWNEHDDLDFVPAAHAAWQVRFEDWGHQAAAASATEAQMAVSINSWHQRPLTLWQPASPNSRPSTLTLIPKSYTVSANPSAVGIGIGQQRQRTLP